MVRAARRADRTSTRADADDLAKVQPTSSTMVTRPPRRRSRSPSTATCPTGQFSISHMLVRRHHQRPCYLPEGAEPRHPAVLVPDRRQGPGRQRPDGDAEGGQEPGARAPVPQPHARPRRWRWRTSASIGYQPPQNSITADALVAEEIHPGEPATRDRASESYFDTAATAARAVARGRRRLARRSGSSSRPGPDSAVRNAATRSSARCSPCRGWPGWSCCSSWSRCYVVLAIVFGTIDPIFRTPVPAWNPLQWDPTQFRYVFSPDRRRRTGSSARRWCAPSSSSWSRASLCLLIAFPVAYFVARLAGRRRRACCWRC